MLSEELFQRLVLKVHEAAIDSSQWDSLLRSVAETFQASSAILLTPGEQDTHERFLWSSYGLDPASQADYGRHWVAQDPWNDALARRHTPISRGNLLIADSYLPRAELLKTAFYNEYGAANGLEGLASLVVEVKASNQAVPMTVLSLARRPGMEPFTRSELRGFQALHPHLSQAVRTHWLLVAAQGAAFRTALDLTPHPTFILSTDAEARFANRAGESLLRTTSVLHHGHGVLEGVGQMEVGALQAAVRLAARGVGQALDTWWRVPNARFRTATIRLAPIDSDVRFGLAGPRAAVLMTIEMHDPMTRNRAILQAAAQRFGLTPAEVRVLAALQQGSSVDECAEELRVQISTVRTHLANLLHKTGCRRQSDLLRLDHVADPRR